MAERGLGNEVQARAVIEQVADAAVAKFAQTHPELAKAEQPVKAEIPAPLKWAATIAAAVLTLGVCGGITWTVSTLNVLQITVARMDERMQQDVTGKEIMAVKATVEKHDERLTRLEQRKGGE